MADLKNMLTRIPSLILGLALATPLQAEPVIHGTQFDLTADAVLQEVSVQEPEVIKKLKDDETLIKKFVDAMYNESLFAQTATKQKLADDPKVASKIAAATRKVLVEELIERKKQSIKVPDMQALAEAEYQSHPENYTSNETVHARHILLRADDSNKTEKIQTLQAIVKRVQAGEDFAVLAKQYSEDKGSGARGGDLGVFAKGQMLPAFEEAAFALTQPKQLSGIVETKYGVHLIQLLEHHPAKTKPFSEVKAEAIANLEQEYIKNEMKNWRTAIIDPSNAKLNEAELLKVISAVKALP